MIAGLAFLLSGCTPGAGPTELEPAESPATPIPTLRLTDTAIPQSTATESPTPTATHWLQNHDVPIGDIAYKIPLTILHVTDDSATLFFELETRVEGKVVLLPVSGTGQVIEINLNPQQTRYVLPIQGLQRRTEYKVVVLVEPEEGEPFQPGFLAQPWGPVHLRTISEADTVRFGMLSDASFGDPVTTQLILEMAEYDLDFVLNAGDVVDEVRAEIDPFVSYAEKYYKPFEPLLSRMPVYTVPGNHDYDLDIRYEGEPFFYYAFPPFVDPLIPSQTQPENRQFYAFSYAGVQFLMLDTQTFFGIPGRQEQLEWLSERIADTSFKTSLPVFHVSPFSSSVVHPNDSLPVRSSWVPLFEEEGVPLVLSGHFHHYERFTREGITYIVSGGGSSILYAQGQLLPGSELYRRQSHFLLVEIYETRLSLQAIALGGEIIDSLEISLP
jgi:predicted phosphodiesterase